LTGTPLSWHHRSIPLSPMGDSLSVMTASVRERVWQANQGWDLGAKSFSFVWVYK
jgi:hypothetical protein